MTKHWAERLKARDTWRVMLGGWSGIQKAKLLILFITSLLALSLLVMHHYCSNYPLPLTLSFYPLFPLILDAASGRTQGLHSVLRANGQKLYSSQDRETHLARMSGLKPISTPGRSVPLGSMALKPWGWWCCC